MSPDIDYDTLEMAMSHSDPYSEATFFFDPDNGRVLLVSDWAESQARLLTDPNQADEPDIRLAWYTLLLNGKIGPESAEETALWEQAQTYVNRLLPVPHIDSHDGYQDMADFTRIVSNRHLRHKLETVLTMRKPFRRFKDVLLNYPDAQANWFAFRDKRMRDRIDEWLASHGISSDEQAGEA